MPSPSSCLHPGQERDCPNFCVVTPNYNMGMHLGATIESVLRNLVPGDEYYVVDGGSTDQSIHVLQHFGPRITGWVSEADNGYVDALAKGFAMGSAPLMCWINSGDLLLNGALDLARKEFAASDADLLYADDYYIDEAGFILQHSSGYVADLQKMMLYAGWTPLQDACFWKRKLYDAVGGMDTSLRYAGDYDLFLRMSMHGKCRYFPAVVSAFRRHAFQKSIVSSKAYELERAKIQELLLRRKVGGAKSRMQKFKYGTISRLRAHLRSWHRRESDYVGAHIDQVHARLLRVETEH